MLAGLTSNRFLFFGPRGAGEIAREVYRDLAIPDRASVHRRYKLSLCKL